MNDAKLIDLADHCNNGACNLYALTLAFAEAAKEVGVHEFRKHPAVPVILGQLGWLCDGVNAIGPTFEALEAYEAFKTQRLHEQQT
jgi:hypothetical protein